MPRCELHVLAASFYCAGKGERRGLDWGGGKSSKRTLLTFDRRTRMSPLGIRERLDTLRALAPCPIPGCPSAKREPTQEGTIINSEAFASKD